MSSHSPMSSQGPDDDTSIFDHDIDYNYNYDFNPWQDPNPSFSLRSKFDIARG